MNIARAQNEQRARANLDQITVPLDDTAPTAKPKDFEMGVTVKKSDAERFAAIAGQGVSVVILKVANRESRVLASVPQLEIKDLDS